MSEFVDSMKRTAAEMAGIDNSWNLLHIASQVLPALIDRGRTPQVCAKKALEYAHVLLQEWRKSQGEDYGENKDD